MSTQTNGPAEPGWVYRALQVLTVVIMVAAIAWVGSKIQGTDIHLR